jgi:hypothetical protein
MTDPTLDIDFATYAEVLAHLRHFPADKQEEVVARLGHDPGAWRVVAAKWSAARDSALEEGDADLANRFGSVFTRTRSRLQLQQPSLESLGPLPPPRLAPPQPAVPPEPSAPEPSSPPEVEMQQSTAQRGAVAAAALPSFLAVPVASPLPAVVRPPSALTSTVAVVIEPPASAGHLPFRTADPAVALEGALAHARAVQGEPRPAAAMAGGTVGISTDDPAHSAPPPGCPDLTLPQYASLRVELHQRPADTAAILARYGVSADARAALDAHWRARFEADPLRRMEFARAYAAYLAWLRRGG